MKFEFRWTEQIDFLGWVSRLEQTLLFSVHLFFLADSGIIRTPSVSRMSKREVLKSKFSVRKKEQLLRDLALAEFYCCTHEGKIKSPPLVRRSKSVLHSSHRVCFVLDFPVNHSFCLLISKFVRICFKFPFFLAQKLCELTRKAENLLKFLWEKLAKP